MSTNRINTILTNTFKWSMTFRFMKFSIATVTNVSNEAGIRAVASGSKLSNVASKT